MMFRRPNFTLSLQTFPGVTPPPRPQSNNSKQSFTQAATFQEAVRRLSYSITAFADAFCRSMRTIRFSSTALAPVTDRKAASRSGDGYRKNGFTFKYSMKRPNKKFDGLIRQFTGRSGF